MKQNLPLVLIILDGWGYRKETEFNAIAAARTPNWDDFLAQYPNTLISGSGKCVGLPDGQMGNSEVGHMNMGAGRIVHQDFTRIDEAIEDLSFFANPVFNEAINRAKHLDKAIHIMGLLSPGGVHSHENHFIAFLRLCAEKKFKKVYIHAFLDGRDTPPKSAMRSIKKIDSLCKILQCGQIASLIGRYYAMDRDNRWERIQKAYDLITYGQAAYHNDNALHALELAYARGETDEFVSATSLHPIDMQAPVIADGDQVIFMNFRSDRARELTQAFIQEKFTAFARPNKPKLANFICMTQYDELYQTPIAFPPHVLSHQFPQYISELGLRQLRIAETEKYAHVTFFFNGGIETIFPQEERILVPSPKVATYDLHPEMSAIPLTERLIEEIDQKKHDVIICNFANPDMVGHTGNFDATVQAIETVDRCLGKIIPAVLAVGGEVIITADHGNAEKMFNPQTNQPHTAHTSDPVPFIYIGRKAEIIANSGKLSDIAPTMLYLLGIPPPPEMTGKTLLKLL